jgi:hypothetical protein
MNIPKVVNKFIEDSKKLIADSATLGSAVGALPCPFCNELPTFGMSHGHPTPIIRCVNYDCKVMPSISESNQVDENTYRDLIVLWNTRGGVKPAKPAKPAKVDSAAASVEI